ncbi:hypothetical protein FGO68_gene17239 [Halteria grandinella]|uniref:Uncharacterized protein n=1 Tax=Halteria grandinella TaxID=5974 RepID=A0A8J8T3C9_HALGN|nr:hypothetical protein FGO68_gene17239 [Halteria grandinella]
MYKAMHDTIVRQEDTIARLEDTISRQEDTLARQAGILTRQEDTIARLQEEFMIRQEDSNRVKLEIDGLKKQLAASNNSIAFLEQQYSLQNQKYKGTRIIR